MKKREYFAACLIFMAAFALWTAAVMTFDVQPIGPEGSAVGFGTLNGCFHEATGVNWWLYDLTDWLSLVPLVTVAGFGLLGLSQLVKRRSIRKVDRSILILGGFYILVAAAYVAFEVFPVNCRPVLIGGVLEASYPSSTTMLVLTVMPTAAMELRRRRGSRLLTWGAGVFAVLMLMWRLFSGVHWITDIIGGILLSGTLVMFYCAVRLEEKGG